MYDNEQIEHMFTYHPPKNDQAERYQNLREKAKIAALVVLDYHKAILDLCPTSPEKLQALARLDVETVIRSLDESVMRANAAIARNE